MLFLLLALVLAGATSRAAADVHYVEEVTNSGLGPKKVGARKTTNNIYIKGTRQKVSSQIEASKELAQALEREGKSLNSSTILRLDKDTLLKVDHVRQTFSQEKLPAPKPAAAQPQSAPATGAPELHFRIQTLPDTTRIQGILCRRVAAELRARHFQPGTRTVRKENRYLYQAWIAKDFPGYEEIQRFQRLQTQKTSYPPLISGDLEQLKGLVEDYDQLVEQTRAEALEGVVMESVLKVFVNSGKGEEQLFQLGRKVKSLSYSALPDAVFEVSEDLNEIAP